MSCEVLAEAYSFVTSRETYLFELKEPEESFPFLHNPLHDLESLVWINIWMLFFNDDANRVLKDPAQIKERQDHMMKLFPRTLDFALGPPKLPPTFRLLSRLILFWSDI